MNQVLLGISIPFVLGALYYACRRFRASMKLLILLPVAMAASAAWAIAPDIPRLMGMQDLYSKLARDPRMNIFYWHYSIDQIEADSRWFSVLFVAIIAAMLLAAYRELVQAERGASLSNTDPSESPNDC